MSAPISFMEIAFNVPINSVSFGQTSINLLKEAKRQGHTVFLFPIGPVDLSTSNPTQEFKDWLNASHQRALFEFSADIPCFKLWHLVTVEDKNQTVKPQLDRVSHNTKFLSFYELDTPTKIELNVAKNFDMMFSSQYTCEVFAEQGVKTKYVPLGFDADTFKRTDKRYFPDDRITFALLGKFEHRKHHAKLISAWIKRFGNDKRYYLQLAIYNPFFPPQMNQNLINAALVGKYYWNVNPLQWIPTNQAYNDFLNSNNIVIGMSGGEGWGLPEFQAVALGKHAVIMNAHGYKSWADTENSVLVNPLNKISAVDDCFFKKDAPYNQGSIFNFDDEEFIHGCEIAIQRYQQQPINSAGIKLQTNFTFEKTLNTILST